MKNIRYPVLLLDADRTLFDFEKSKAAALQAAYQGAGLEAVQTYSPEILARYSDINESWWRRLERGGMHQAPITDWAVSGILCRFGGAGRPRRL